MADVRVLAGGVVAMKLSKDESDDLATAVVDVLAGHIDEVNIEVLERIGHPAAAEAAPDLGTEDAEVTEETARERISAGLRNQILRAALTGIRRELRHRHIIA